MVCHYCLFNHEFRFKNFVRNGCHELAILSINIIDIAIITVKNVNYHCLFHGIKKYKAIHLLQNSILYDCGYI